MSFPRGSMMRVMQLTSEVRVAWRHPSFAIERRRGHMSWPYFVQGTVVHGFGRGSKELGCPTANLDEETVSKVNIPTGVYWGLAQLVHLQEASGDSPGDANEIWPMICSVGFNPHYGNKSKSLEVHILHQFPYDFYGSIVKVAICGRIRDELSFPSLQALIDAIESDKKFAQKQLELQDTSEIRHKLTLEETFKR